MNITRISAIDAPKYAERLVAIYKELWLKTMPSAALGVTKQDIEKYFENLDERIAIWRERILRNPNRALWVLRKKTDEIVGFAIATRQPGDYELDFVFVLPEYQGLGYGLKLTKKCLEWLGDDEPVLLGVAEHNSKAINFYKKLGFRVSEEKTRLKMLDNGKQIAWIEMVRP